MPGQRVHACALVCARAHARLLDARRCNWHCRGVHAGAAGAQELQRQIEAILQDLQQRGYVQQWQVVWGQSNMEVPYQWEASAGSAAAQSTCSSSTECLRNFQARALSFVLFGEGFAAPNGAGSHLRCATANCMHLRVHHQRCWTHAIIYLLPVIKLECL